MNKLEDRLKDISEIRSLMENSSKFLSLSGLSGISAGTTALLGAAAAYWKLELNTRPGIDLSTFFLLDAILVLTATLALAIFFSVRMARKKGLPIRGITTKNMLVSLSIPLITGGVFCCLLWLQGIYQLIAPATLLFYGLALVNTSKYTLHEIRYLGLIQIALGLLATGWTGLWLVCWVTGFGIMHIAYGIFMYLKYET
jgi:hypothetical protein